MFNLMFAWPFKFVRWCIRKFRDKRYYVDFSDYPDDDGEEGYLMSCNQLTPYDDRMCPIYDKVIDGELCYETSMCMQGFFTIHSVPESVHIKPKFYEAKKICTQCPYGDMD